MKGTRNQYRSGFDPTQIPGCHLWFDAADRNTFTLSGSNVTQWRDKSSNGYSLNQGGTASRVTLTTNNGSNVVYINSDGTTNGWMTGSIPLPANMCVFQVITPLAYSGGGTWQIFWSWQWGSAGNYVPGFRSTLATPDFQPYTAWFGNNGNTRSITNGTTYLNFLEFSNSGSNVRQSINGNLSPTAGTLITYNYTPTTFLLGGDGSNGPSIYSRFYLSEFIIFSNILTTAQRQQVEGYLSRKWGRMGDLPATHVYKSVPPTLRPFAPIDVSGCSLWLDGADSSTMTLSGSNVTEWRDKSGNGVNVAAASSTPVYQTNQIGGLPGVVFAGSNRLTASYTYATQTTVFVVCTTSNTTQAGRMIDINGNSYGNFAVPWITSTSSPAVNTDCLLWLGGSNYPAQSIYSTRAPQTGARLYAGIFNGTSSQIWRNGTQETVLGSGFAGPANGTTIAIGSSAFGIFNPESFIGSIGEILLFKAILTASQRQQVEGYLAKKWGLQSSLPSGHPYYYVTPSSFLPTQITGCHLWLDASDTNSMTISGSTVTKWNDKSGNGYSLNQGGTASRVTLTTNNGSNVVYINSDGTTNGWMTGSIPLPSNMCVFQVLTPFQYAGAGTWQVPWAWQWGSPGNYIPGFRITNATPDFQPYITWYGNNGNTLSISNGITYLNFLEFSNSGSNVRQSINGNLTPSSGTLATYNYTPSTFLLGGDGSNGPSLYARFYLSEFIIFSNILTTTQRQQVEGYLAHKWGLRNKLPAPQPYQYSLPAMGTGFTPQAISGCQLWLDGADRTTITLSGSNVTQWNDKSGNGYNMSVHSTFSNGTVASNYQNGLNVLNFSGSNVYKAPTSSGCYPLDCYIVMALKSPLTRCDVISLNTNTSTDNFNSLTFGEYTTLRWHNGSSGFSRTPNTVSASNETSSNFLLMNWTIANNNFIIRRNGTQLTQTASYTFTMTSGSIFQLGFRQSTAIGGTIDVVLSAYIAEIVVFNSQLTTPTRQQVEGYLAWKWGLLGSLPNNHPYRLTKP